MSIQVKFVESARLIKNCISAFTTNTVYLVKASPGTPLRVMVLMWIDFESKRKGLVLTRVLKDQLAALILYHAALNRFFDRKGNSLSKQLKARRILKRAGLSNAWATRYRGLLEGLDGKNRSIFESATFNLREARIFRESEISLFYDEINNLVGLNPDQGSRRAILSFMFLIQFLDDCVDVKLDLKNRLITYASMYALTKRKTMALRHNAALLGHYCAELRLHQNRFERLILSGFGRLLLFGIKRYKRV